MDALTIILGGLTIASACGAIAGTFYGASQRTIIQTLRDSNSAYAERNRLLEDEAAERDKAYATKLAELEGRIKGLEALKMEPLIAIINKNHKEVLATLRDDKK